MVIISPSLHGLTGISQTKGAGPEPNEAFGATSADWHISQETVGARPHPKPDH